MFHAACCLFRFNSFTWKATCYISIRSYTHHKLLSRGICENGSFWTRKCYAPLNVGSRWTVRAADATRLPFGLSWICTLEKLCNALLKMGSCLFFVIMFAPVRTQWLVQKGHSPIPQMTEDKKGSWICSFVLGDALNVLINLLNESFLFGMMAVEHCLVTFSQKASELKLHPGGRKVATGTHLWSNASRK